MKYYHDYAISINAPKSVHVWIDLKLSKFLKTNPENTNEIEHIIDYLNKAKKPEKMSYKEALGQSVKWTKTLQKKGDQIKESPNDTEVILDFNDGFKFIKLIGEKAYQREGYLMRHCVSSYYGKEDIIYSLRDKNNNPHCTISSNSKQIKGKGNGEIHPNYIEYVIKFLEFLKIEVRDSEMKNLGYINLSVFKDKIKNKLFKDKYFYKKDKLILKDKKIRVIYDKKDISENTFLLGDFNCYNNNLTKFTIPNNFSCGGGFYCSYNKLTKLIIPDNFSCGGDFNCSYNDLTELTIPENFNCGGGFYCYDNNLTELILSDNFSCGGYFNCSNNKLTELILPDNFSCGRDFNCSYNNLTELKIPKVFNKEIIK